MAASCLLMEGREMHIPDGFLSIPVSVVSYATSAIGVGASIRSLKKNMADRMIPTMGALAAFIFAAQMFNFPVAGGTSGHLMGGFLAAVLVGPMAATIIISVVLIVQCLLFQDGGLLALGANMLNMALFATWGGWAIYRSLSALSRRGFRWAAIFIAAWSSLVIASAACAI
ncbi:MAG TPA: energy-coupling factor ABC transporter permease, partial [bacterium]|nr:energy-coupling factor ABC transporter permease [bacterium]